MLATEITLNRIARRQLEGLDELIARLPASELDEHFESACLMALQAGAKPTDIAQARRRFGPPKYWELGEASLSAPMGEVWARIDKLPKGELPKTLRIVLGMFVVADERRRVERPDCAANACQHWWHWPEDRWPCGQGHGVWKPPREVNQDVLRAV